MKTKRWISLLLTLALCLGLLPGTVLAEGEETTASTPVVSLKLTSDEAGSVEFPVTSSSDSSYAYTVYYDKSANTTDVVYLHLTGATFAEGTSITAEGPISSELSSAKNMLKITHGTGDSSGCSGTATFTFGNQTIAFSIRFIPVDTTRIYDDDEVKCNVDPGKAVAYTFAPTIYVNGMAKRLSSADYSSSNYTFSCDETIGTLSWPSDVSELIVNTTNATPGATGYIKITDNNNKVYTYEITVNAPPSDENTDSDENQETLPEGYLQMYAASNKNGENLKTEVTMSAGNHSPQYLFIDDAKGKVYLPTDIANKGATYTYSCTDGLGRIFWDGDNNQFGWTAVDGIPGTSGYLYVEVTANGQTTKYAIEAKVNGNPEVLYDDKGACEFTVSAGMEQAFTFPPTIYVDGVEKCLVAGNYNTDYMFATTVGSLFWHETYNELAINTVGITSTTSGVITVTNKSTNTVYTCEITVNAPPSDENTDSDENQETLPEGYQQMYFQTTSGRILDNIELAAKSSLILNRKLFSDTDGTLVIDIADNCKIDLSSDTLGNIVFPPDGNRVWDTSEASVGASGYLYIEKGTQKYAIEVLVKEPNNQPSGPVMLAPERPVVDSDKREIDWNTFDWDAVDTITYKGITYCVGPLRTFPSGGVTVLQPDRNRKGQGEIRIGRCVGFYQPGPEGNIITPAPSVIAELVAGFNGTLKLDLYAVTNPDSEYFKDYAKNYPAVYAFNGFTDWPCRIAHYFSKGTDGRWLIEVTGTFTDENGNQTQVCTQATYTNENPPIEEYTATDLDDASEKLAQWAEENDPSLRYFLDLPEGELTGTLVIPEGCDAFIRGNNKTTIVGGVQNDGGDVVIQGVQFIGAGKVDPAEGEHVWEPRGALSGPSWRGHWESTYEKQWLKTWPKDSSLKGEPNYAIYGTGSVQIQGCSFQGYLHVIHCAKDGYGQGVISGDINSTFQDNAVVYYLDGHSRGLANSDMLGSRFIRNGCVFWIDGYTRNQHTGVYRFLSCIFKENQIDAVNLSKRWFFMDHNFFMGKDAEGNDVIGPVFMGSNGNTDKKETYISAFPYAADEEFKKLIYDKDAIMSSAKTSENKIPEKELDGMTITIIEDDQEAAVWSFGEENT